jgi:diguanylate cyclase (GGDEF)-like protein
VVLELNCCRLRFTLEGRSGSYVISTCFNFFDSDDLLFFDADIIKFMDDYFNMKLSNRRLNEFSPVFVNEINQSLTSLAYKQANMGLTTGFICAAIIWYRLHSYINNINLSVWAVALFTLTLLRFALIKIYHMQANPDDEIKKWRNYFIVTSLLGGLCWGYVGTAFLSYVNPNDQVLILMILAGITAGAVAFMAGILIAAYAFLIAALLPVSLHYIATHADYLIGVTVLIYLLFLLFQTKRIHNMLQKGLLLQFELKEAKNLLEQTATHDPLTNVANRHLFNDYFAQAIAEAKTAKTMVALLYLDLNKFKLINDTNGHSTGDQVLLAFVERLKSLFKEKDMIARLGGDEFTVTIRHFSKHEKIDETIKKVNDILKKPIILNNQEFNISASLGISVYPDDGFDVETLLKVADNNMYKMKKTLA